MMGDRFTGKPSL